jgi:hypothetical protein
MNEERVERRLAAIFAADVAGYRRYRTSGSQSASRPNEPDPPPRRDIQRNHCVTVNPAGPGCRAPFG